MRILVVLPTYDESATIERILETVRTSLPGADVLVVDDSSPDGTAKIAEDAGERLGQVFVLSRPTKDGLGNAYKAGFAWGIGQGYEAMCEMDSDFSHDPADLPRLAAPIMGNQADLVIGSRRVPGGAIPDWSMLRRAISGLGNVYANVMLGLGVKDSTAGYRVYSASLLSRIDLDRIEADSYGFQVEMTYRSKLAGGRIVELPIRFVDRREGTSKMSSRTVTEALRIVTVLGFKRMLGRGQPEAKPTVSIG